MKIGYIILLTLLIGATVKAQENDLFAKGTRVFVESESKNENALKTNEELKTHLKEWGYWELSDNKSNADFVLETDVTASKGITAVSWGGTSYILMAKIIDKEGEVHWESDAYKSSPNGTNGFNSSKAVVKKVMRDLKKKFE